MSSHSARTAPHQSLLARDIKRSKASNFTQDCRDVNTQKQSPHTLGMIMSSLMACCKGASSASAASSLCCLSQLVMCCTLYCICSALEKLHSSLRSSRLFRHVAEMKYDSCTKIC